MNGDEEEWELQEEVVDVLSADIFEIGQEELEEVGEVQEGEMGIRVEVEGGEDLEPVSDAEEDEAAMDIITVHDEELEPHRDIEDVEIKLILDLSPPTTPVDIEVSTKDIDQDTATILAPATTDIEEDAIEFPADIQIGRAHV